MFAMVVKECRLISLVPTRVRRENCQKRNGCRIIWEVNPMMQIARSWLAASFLGKGRAFLFERVISSRSIPSMN